MLTQGTLNCEGLPSFVPTMTAARMLKVSKQRVYQLIKEGAIVAQQCDGTWMVNVRSIQARIALLAAESAGAAPASSGSMRRG